VTSPRWPGGEDVGDAERLDLLGEVGECVADDEHRAVDEVEVHEVRDGAAADRGRELGDVLGVGGSG
jgi:hypothetical protein